MISQIKKIIICFFSLIILVLINGVYSGNTDTTGNDPNNISSQKSEFPKEFQDLQLNIALVVSDKETSPRVAFIVKNTGMTNIVIPDFRENQNRIEIIKPNGKKAGEDSWWSNKTNELIIKPSDSKVWFMEASQLLRTQQEEGLYRIKWKIYNVESKELLLLKEKNKEEVKNSK